MRGADIMHPLQGIPAHRFRRARRGARDAGGQGDPRRHQAGHVALRLRHDRRVPDLARAGPRLRRQDEEARGPGRRALGLARARLHRRATCPSRARACSSSPTTPRRAGDALAQRARRGDPRASAATWYPPYLSSTRRSTAAYAEPKGPVVVADPSDNAGGGAASDNTNIIRRLLERGLRRCRGRPVVGPGRGRVLSCGRRRRRRIPLRFGGKTAPSSGAADRRRGDGDRPRSRTDMQSLRQRQGEVRRRRRHPRRRRRGRADRASHAGARPRDLHRGRHRPRRRSATSA